MNIFYKINLIFLTLIICSIKNYSAQNVSAVQQLTIIEDNNKHTFTIIAYLDTSHSVVSFNDKEIFIAALYNQFQSLMSLRQKGQSLKSIAKDGKSILHFALLSEKPNLDFIKFYLKSGVPIDQQDDQGQTALHFAVSYNLDEVVSLLLKHKAKSLQDKNGFTPLHLAVGQSQPNDKIVQLLTQNKTDLMTKDKHGLMPLFLAILKGNRVTVQKLLEVEPNTSLYQYQGININDFIDRLLLKNKEDIDKTNQLMLIKDDIQKLQAPKPS